VHLGKKKLKENTPKKPRQIEIAHTLCSTQIPGVQHVPKGRSHHNRMTVL